MPQRREALIAAGQIGQKTINSRAIKPPHHFHRQAAQAVGFIEQGRDNQQAPRPAVIKAEGVFAPQAAVSGGAGPCGDHAA